MKAIIEDFHVINQADESEYELLEEFEAYMLIDSKNHVYTGIWSTSNQALKHDAHGAFYDGCFAHFTLKNFVAWKKISDIVIAD